jgi:hypothetical protein
MLGMKEDLLAIRRWAALSVLAIASTMFAQSHVPIRGTQNVRLAASVERAIQVDGLKDRMRCDAAHDIYMPANRGYSSAWGSVVEIMADGKQFHSFSLDDIPDLETGHVEDFEITDRGGLYVLAREVRKYSDLEVPVEFGSTYILRFSPAGKLENQTKLNTDFGDAKPSGLAVLKGENFLVASYLYTSDKKVRLFVNIFSSDGSLKRKASISGDGTQASNRGSVGSMSVIRPMTVKSGGLIFVLRGSTRDPIYIFSDSGELTRTVKLQATNVEFTSPKILGNRLVVHREDPPRPSGSVLTEPDLDVFPVFDLDSGALIQQFEWGQRGELACYDGTTLTVMQQGLDYPAKSYYTIIDAQPIAAKEAQPSHPPDASIKLELHWIVPCTNEAHSVPLRGDEAASRYCLSENPVVDQGEIDSASAYVDALNRPGLRLTFTPEGSEKLRRATTAKNNAELGFVIDGELVLKAIVVQPFGHEAAISGAGLHEEELLDWVARLNAEARKRALRKSTKRGETDSFEIRSELFSEGIR